MSLFSRRHAQPEDPQAVVDRLAAAGGTIPAAAPGTGQANTAASTGFRMTVEDVFAIKGRGVVVTGSVAAGQVSRGMQVVIYRAGSRIDVLTVTGLEMFRKQIDIATAGQYVGLLVSATDRAALQPGDVVADQ